LLEHRLPPSTEKFGLDENPFRTQENVMIEKNRTTVLAIVPNEEDYRPLEEMFAHSNWTVHRVRTRMEALDCLRACDYPVVLCEVELPDGWWRDVLSDVDRMADHPLLIVTAPHGDTRLWAEVLNLGGFDVLEKPLNRTEVFTVVSFAWHQWHRRSRAAKHARAAA
jgi:DNA-binding NtrC family response regulator